jgi:hypothetical protein
LEEHTEDRIIRLKVLEKKFKALPEEEQKEQEAEHAIRMEELTKDSNNKKQKGM